jgi:hypothetical protein
VPKQVFIARRLRYPAKGREREPSAAVISRVSPKRRAIASAWAPRRFT